MVRIALAVVPLLAAIGAYAQTPAAPSYLEFSTYFQIRANAIDSAFGALTSAGANGEFYVAGVLSADLQSLTAFPKQPINPYPPFAFSTVSFIARFSAAGQLMDWRLLGNPFSPSSLSPTALLTDVPGRVALVIGAGLSPALAEPATDGAFLAASGSASLLALSSDLRTVLVSTFLAPQNSTVNEAVLDRDGSLVYTGSSNAAFARDGTTTPISQFGFPFLARLSADGKSLLQIQPAGASRIALASDGGVWLGVSTSNATLPTAGPAARAYTGANLATWNPAGGAWTPYLSPEITGSGLSMTVQGHPNRPGQFLGSDGVSLYRSRDSGATWQALSGFPGGAVFWCLADPNRLYTWVNPRLWASGDAGDTWNPIPLPAFGDPAFVPGIAQLAIAADNADLVAIRSSVGSYIVSSDGGKTWQPIDLPGPRPQSPTIAVESGNGPRLLVIDVVAGIQAHDAGGTRLLAPLPANAIGGSRPTYYSGSPPVIAHPSTSGGLLVTTDYGASWTDVGVCGFDDGPCSLWINPASSNEWWITGSRAWRSTDAGQSWSVVRDALGPARVTSLAFTGAGGQPILATTARMGDIYVRKLDAAWHETTFATYLGGSNDEGLAALLVDSAGRLNVVATTSSPDFPVTADAIETGVAGIGVALTRFSPSADAIEFSSTWGGLADDRLARARLLPGDRIVWCGTTNSSSPPNLAEPLAEPLATFSTNAFVGGYDPAASAWLPTYLFGGQGSTATRDCAATSEGKIAVVGATDSAAFPLAGAGLPPLPGTRSRMFVSLIRQFQGGIDEKQRHPKQPPHLPDHGGARRPRRVR